MRADTQWLRLRQVATLQQPWLPLRAARRPARGWISTVRQALGMTVEQFAGRLGVTRQSAASLEAREADGGATLEALRRAADALGCDLVYALVPKVGSLEAAVEAQARAVARRLVGRAGQTMALEAQAVDADEAARQEEVIVRRLLAEWPRDLWDQRAPEAGAATGADARADRGRDPGADDRR